MNAYPVYLTNLDEQRAVVVGSGPTVERKVKGLLDADARVTLIAPDPPPQLSAWAHAGRLEWRDRRYRRGDLQTAALVIVTEACAEAKRRIRKDAREQNVLLNIAGDTDESTFANGAVLRRGPLVVSVSTAGGAPSLAVRIREKLAEEVGAEYEELLTIMNALRDPMQEQVSDVQARRDRWYAILDSDVLELLADGRREDALDRIESIVGPTIMKQTEGCF